MHNRFNNQLKSEPMGPGVGNDVGESVAHCNCNTADDPSGGGHLLQFVEPCETHVQLFNSYFNNE